MISSHASAKVGLGCQSYSDCQHQWMCFKVVQNAKVRGSVTLILIASYVICHRIVASGCTSLKVELPSIFHLCFYVEPRGLHWRSKDWLPSSKWTGRPAFLTHCQIWSDTSLMKAKCTRKLHLILPKSDKCSVKDWSFNLWKHCL